MEIKLINMGTINKNKVCIVNDLGQEINLYFSYETIVGINQYTRQNSWGTTTGKLLNELEPDHKKRLNEQDFNKKKDELLKEFFKEVEA